MCHLHKALYGLKQAPHAWYLKFSTYIQQMGFIRCPYDQSLFYRIQGSDILLLLIYVDDILLTGNSASQIKKLIAHLSVVFHMKDLGDIHYFLGLQITRDESTIPSHRQGICCHFFKSLVLMVPNQSTLY